MTEVFMVFDFQSEVQHLRRENEALREGGAVGGVTTAEKSASHRRLAKDLRLAAATAENNLK